MADDNDRAGGPIEGSWQGGGIVEGEDYYVNEKGLIVFTERYHLKRGNCCGSGCRHCPYNYTSVPEPKRTDLLIRRSENQNGHGNQKD
jgi:hypothetical protein